MRNYACFKTSFTKTGTTIISDWKAGINIAIDVGSLSALASALFEIAKQYGYLGVFAYALVGSLIPFVPLPYLAAAVFLSPVLNPFLIGIAAGVGGSIGKVTSYFLGRGGYLLSGDKSKKNFEVIRELTKKYGDFIIFIFAATPLPDDVYIIPAGLMKFPFWRFLIANTAGKIVLATFVSFLSREYFKVASSLLGGNSLPVIIAAIAITVVITIMMITADWSAYIDVYRKDGLRGLILHFPALVIPRRRKS